MRLIISKKSFIVFLVFFYIQNIIILADENLLSEKAYIINLDQNTNRFFYVAEQLKSFNIKFERFSAINGYNVQIKDDKNNNYTGRDLKENKLTPKENKIYKINCSNDVFFNINYINRAELLDKRTDFLTAGELGCTCSHQILINKAFKKKNKTLFILEDDVKFTKNLPEILKKVPSNWNKKCDILFLFFPKIGKIKIKDICTNKICNILSEVGFFNNIVNRYVEGLSFLRKVHIKRQFHGAVAYIINKKGINKLNNLLQNIPYNLPIDLYYQFLIQEKKINACYIEKSGVDVNYDLGSDILSMTNLKIR